MLICGAWGLDLLARGHFSNYKKWYFSLKLFGILRNIFGLCPQFLARTPKMFKIFRVIGMSFVNHRIPFNYTWVYAKKVTEGGASIYLKTGAGD